MPLDVLERTRVTIEKVKSLRIAARRAAMCVAQRNQTGN